MNAFSKQMSGNGKVTSGIVRCVAEEDVPSGADVDPERYAHDWCLDCRKGILRPVIGMDTDEALCVECFDELMAAAAADGIEVKVQPIIAGRPVEAH
jgi:hypothetical protein